MTKQARNGRRRKPPIDKNDLRDAIERVVNLARHPIFPEIQILAWRDAIYELDVILQLLKDGRL